jgi:hypothetical protein
VILYIHPKCIRKELVSCFAGGQVRSGVILSNSDVAVPSFVLECPSFGKIKRCKATELTRYAMNLNSTYARHRSCLLPYLSLSPEFWLQVTHLDGPRTIFAQRLTFAEIYIRIYYVGIMTRGYRCLALSCCATFTEGRKTCFFLLLYYESAS